MHFALAVIFLQFALTESQNEVHSLELVYKVTHSQLTNAHQLNPQSNQEADSVNNYLIKSLIRKNSKPHRGNRPPIRQTGGYTSKPTKTTPKTTRFDVQINSPMTSNDVSDNQLNSTMTPNNVSDHQFNSTTNKVPGDQSKKSIHDVDYVIEPFGSEEIQEAVFENTEIYKNGTTAEWSTPTTFKDETYATNKKTDLDQAVNDIVDLPGRIGCLLGCLSIFEEGVIKVLANEENCGSDPKPLVNVIKWSRQIRGNVIDAKIACSKFSVECLLHIIKSVVLAVPRVIFIQAFLAFHSAKELLACKRDAMLELLAYTLVFTGDIFFCIFTGARANKKIFGRKNIPNRGKDKGKRRKEIEEEREKNKSTSKPSGIRSTSKPSGNKSSTKVSGNQSSTKVSGNQSSTKVSGNQSSTQMSGNQSSTKVSGNQSSTKVSGNQSSTQMSGNQSSTKVSGNQSSTQMSGNQSSTQMSGNQSSTKVSGNQSITKVTGSQSSTTLSLDQISSIISENGFEIKLSDKQLDNLLKEIIRLKKNLEIALKVYETYKEVYDKCVEVEINFCMGIVMLCKKANQPTTCIELLQLYADYKLVSAVKYNKTRTTQKLTTGNFNYTKVSGTHSSTRLTLTFTSSKEDSESKTELGESQSNTTLSLDQISSIMSEDNFESKLSEVELDNLLSEIIRIKKLVEEGLQEYEKYKEIYEKCEEVEHNFCIDLLVACRAANQPTLCREYLGLYEDYKKVTEVINNRTSEFTGKPKL